MKIVLGSQSRWRKLILEEMGYEFEVIPADMDEKSIRFEDPKELTLALARAKAEIIKSKIFEPTILITSDQVVVWQGKIREKPESEDEAREYLQGYNSAPAETVTAVVVTNTKTGKQVEAVDIAKIYFEPFSNEEINQLIKEGSIFDCAGGFTSEDKICKEHIKEIQGTRDSVIGLPKEVLKKLMDEVL